MMATLAFNELIIALLKFRLKGYLEPRNEVGFLN